MFFCLLLDMADADTTSSSDDNWFEPEDLTISTTDLLKQKQQQQQKEEENKFPKALKEAYKSMQNESIQNKSIQNNNNKEDDPSRMIINKDTGLGYDIDNLPIDITETPMLSLQKLRESSRKNLSDTKNKQNIGHDSKRDSQKGKYSKFFVKKFFSEKT